MTEEPVPKRLRRSDSPKPESFPDVNSEKLISASSKLRSAIGNADRILSPRFTNRLASLPFAGDSPEYQLDYALREAFMEAFIDGYECLNTWLASRVPLENIFGSNSIHVLFARQFSVSYF